MEDLIPSQSIENRIFLIRGQKVMLDKDLARLYRVKPTRLREQVKRNRGRFPKEFMFQLTDQEIAFMVSQNAIPSRQHLGGASPYVFTEHGVAMLATMLHSKRAIKISILIIKTFVKLRQLLASHKELADKIKELEQKVGGHEQKFKVLFDAIHELMQPPEKLAPKIGFLRN